MLIGACSPELRGRSCDDNSGCLISEVCTEGLCVTRFGASDGAPDAPADVLVDSPRDDADVAPEVSQDPLSDTADALEVRVCETGAAYERLVPLILREPCDPASLVFPDCFSEDAAYESSRSSFPRAGEPLDVPLVNGLLASRSDTYVSFDADLGPTIGGGLILEPPSDSAVYTTGFDGAEDGALELSSAFMRFMMVEILPGEPATWTVAFYLRMQLVEEGGPTAYLAEMLSALSSNVLLTFVDGDVVAEVRGLGEDGTPAVSVGRAAAPLDDADWHHLALAHAGNSTTFYLDGRPLDMGWEGSVSTVLADPLITVGTDAQGNSGFAGAVDDLVLMTGAMSGEEIARWVGSGQPFGSMLLDSQPDFDDLRVATGAEDSLSPHLFELVGNRPFSDARVEGVLHHWRFEDSFVDRVTGTVGDGENVPGFEDRYHVRVSRAAEFRGSGRVNTGVSLEARIPDGPTIEAWVRVEEAGGALFGWRRDEGVEELTVVVPGTGEPNEGLVVARMYDSTGEIALEALSRTDIRDGDWHYVGLVVLANGTPSLTLVVDQELTVAIDPGQEVGFQVLNSLGLDFYIGGINAADRGGPPGLTGAIDDAMVHESALPIEFLFQRSRPSVPVVRFAVSAIERVSDGSELLYEPVWLISGREAVEPGWSLETVSGGVITEPGTAWAFGEQVPGGACVDW